MQKQKLVKKVSVRTLFPYYRKEDRRYKGTPQLGLFDDRAREFLLNKLAKHFKLGNVKLEFVLEGNVSHASPSENKIYLAHDDVQIIAICHEVAHLIDAKQDKNLVASAEATGDSYMTHDQRFFQILDSVVDYCQKNDYWRKELRKRVAFGTGKLEGYG